MVDIKVNERGLKCNQQQPFLIKFEALLFQVFEMEWNFHYANRTFKHLKNDIITIHDKIHIHLI